MSNRDELLKKIKALAERGEGGEAENAAALLEKLMLKYGITETDLDEDLRTRCEFCWSTTRAFDQELLHQVIFMVVGNVPTYRYVGKKRCAILVECTTAEQIEIQAAFDFYREHLKAGLSKYYRAFVQCEDIFPADDKPQIERSEDPPEYDPDVGMLANVIERHTRRPALVAGSN